MACMRCFLRALQGQGGTAIPPGRIRLQVPTSFAAPPPPTIRLLQEVKAKTRLHCRRRMLLDGERLGSGRLGRGAGSEGEGVCSACSSRNGDVCNGQRPLAWAGCSTGAFCM